MSESINPQMIIWARKRNRLSVEDLAALMKKEPSEIRKWEDGTEAPSYANLEVLASRHLKIPLALFFFPEPPAIEDPVSKFRRLPDYEFDRLSLDTMHMMRMSQGYQESLAELAIGGKGRRKLFRDLNHKGKTIHALANETREYLGITLKNQLAFHSAEDAFKTWRHKLEEAGESLPSRVLLTISLFLDSACCTRSFPLCSSTTPTPLRANSSRSSTNWGISSLIYTA